MLSLAKNAAATTATAAATTVLHQLHARHGAHAHGSHSHNALAQDVISRQSTCESSPPDESHRGLRIASIFVILVGSLLGAVLPIWLSRSHKFKVPEGYFFAAKYFGSGVILATAWIHLLAPAVDELGDDCLDLPEYDWAMGIGLMTTMAMFLIELITAHCGRKVAHDHARSQSNGNLMVQDEQKEENTSTDDLEPGNYQHHHQTETGRHSSGKPVADAESSTITSTGAGTSTPRTTNPGPDSRVDGHPSGGSHLGDRHDHVEAGSYSAYAAEMTALIILEFGVIFHSIFIGLTLAVSENFVILFVVLVFHQTFEGLGLGSRLAMASAWKNIDPRHPGAARRRWTPYAMGLLYAVSTPVSIAIGLGVRSRLALNAAATLITSGVLDAISAGILMYTGLVELLAHEFMFNLRMQNASLATKLSAYAWVALGTCLMALLGKWA